MHARRQPHSRRAPTSIVAGTTAIAYDAGSHNNSNMKYVRLVTANEQASTSYATTGRAPVMTTANFQQPTTQDLFPNGQVITGTATGVDGSIVEYVIDPRDYEASGMPQTMYVEVMPPNMHAQDEDEPRLNEEEVLAIENGYINTTLETPVKKSRYSRMSEADRERYNARRRQRRLDKKTKKLEEDALAKAMEEHAAIDEEDQKVGEVKILPVVIEQNVIPHMEALPEYLTMQEMPPSVEEEEGKPSRSETARNRYHAMTEEERRIYNQKRASAFRKKRKEEEILLITTPDGSSPGRLSQAQEIVDRNARRAEKARQRYQRMTVEERREYNHRRTLAKKARRMAKGETPARNTIITTSSYQQQPPPRSQQIQQQHRQQQRQQSQSSNNQYVNNFVNGMNSNVVNEEALSMLERDVVRRTQVAQMALMRQRRQKQNKPFNTIDDTIEQVATYGAALPLMEQQPKIHSNNNNNPAVVETIQEYVEPSTLPLVILDQHGNPANLPEGSIIEVRQEHPNGPQTIIIHTAQSLLPPPPLPAQQPQPHSNQRYIQHSQISQNQHQQQQPPPMVQFITTSSTSMATQPQNSSLLLPPPHPLSNYIIPVENSQQQQQHQLQSSSKSSPPTSDSTTTTDHQLHPKSELLRARRAARARERYHNMSETDRKQFNARRAVALRRARVRDEELCRLGEEAMQAGKDLDDATNKTINEAQHRRAKRAESARLKYQKMSVDERRIYNANRDANRKAKKNDSESDQKNEENPNSEEIIVDDEPLEFSFDD